MKAVRWSYTHTHHEILDVYVFQRHVHMLAIKHLQCAGFDQESLENLFAT